MRIHLIAVGTRMPAWVEDGYNEFTRRMPPECKLELKEIPAVKRTRSSDLERITSQEGERMLAAIPKNASVLSLDVSGQPWSTDDLTQRLKKWLQGGQDIALLIGGPEGLAEACKKRAQASWSLSKLTLPHPLVRIVVAEQLYRAMSIIKNHPYHK